MEIFNKFIELNRNLIDDYFVLHHPSGQLSLYYSSSYEPHQFKDNGFIEQIAREQNEIFDYSSRDFREIKAVLGVD